MSQACPDVIQINYAPANVDGNSPAPLVLIHDGSGTAFSYFLLGDLGRDVWAIQNTELGKYSMDNMARRYIRCLQDAGISGQVILGGWSFGGYMSLAMSHILAMDTTLGISVTGLLLIDTSYYTTEETASNVECSDDETFAFDHLSEATSDQIKKSFQACESLLREWELPNWSGAAFDGQQAQFHLDGDCHILEHGTLLHRNNDGRWRSTLTEPKFLQGPTGSSILPPPAVALRCVQSSQSGDSNQNFLGWQGTYPEFIKAVIDVDASHHTIFDKLDLEKMDQLTSLLNEGLQILDTIHPYKLSLDVTDTLEA